jgi:DNA helicase-2/ATP-dependent DNA helicase PcrA
MDLTPILNSLNEAQREAVTAPLGPILVLAGAGSGKTRVLTHRIAWLIEAENVSPHGILAVTFTNKAAGEMRGRVEQLLGIPGGALWIGTFHGIAHRLLRLHWRDARLPRGFQILDSEDQQRLIKKLMKAQNLDDTRWVPREVQWFINSNKDEGLRPKDLKDGNDPTRHQFIKLYADYEAACAKAGVVDFAELLLRAYELWRDNAGLLDHYRRRFRHILVDEFRIPTPSSTTGSSCSSDRRTMHSWSVTMTSRFIAGAAHESRTCTSSAVTIRPRNCIGWSRTTAPPAPFSVPPTD